MSPENVTRYHWLDAQCRWHGERAKGNNWHRRQSAWYRKQISQLPGLFTWIVSETFKKQLPALVNNVNKNNALYARLKGARP